MSRGFTRVMVIGTETADELRVAIAFGRTQKIIQQSARQTSGYSIKVYVHWIVFGLLLVAKTAKTSTIVDQTLSAVEITLYIAPCIAIYVPMYDDAPLVISRYVSRYFGRDTIHVSLCIDVSLRPYSSCYIDIDDHDLLYFFYAHNG